MRNPKLHDFAARSCGDLDLQGSDPNVVHDRSLLGKSCKIGRQITKLWARHDFAARSCCDIDI